MFCRDTVLALRRPSYNVYIRLGRTTTKVGIQKAASIPPCCSLRRHRAVACGDAARAAATGLPVVVMRSFAEIVIIEIINGKITRLAQGRAEPNVGCYTVGNESMSSGCRRGTAGMAQIVQI